MNLGADDQLVDKIFQVAQAEKVNIQARLKRYGLNVMQARALNFIAGHPGAIQKQLAESLGRQMATTSNILKVLEAKKLILRTVPEANERQKQLYLQPLGQQVTADLRQIFVDLENKATSGLSDEEQTDLMALLDRVQTGLDA